MKLRIFVPLLLLALAVAAASAQRQAPPRPRETETLRDFRSSGETKVEGQVRPMDHPALDREFDDLRELVKRTSARADAAKPKFRRDSVEEIFQDGGVSLETHHQEIRRMREIFIRAQAALDNMMWEKVTFGNPSDTDKEVFDRSLKRSQEIMGRLDQLDLQANRLKCAHNVRYLEEAWSLHVRTLAETRNLIEDATRATRDTIEHSRFNG